MSADDHPVSDEQIDPVAVVAARLRDLAETTLEFKVGELAEAEQTRDQLKIAEANVAVAKAELGVAEAELRVAKAKHRGDQVKIAGRPRSPSQRPSWGSRRASSQKQLKTAIRP